MAIKLGISACLMGEHVRYDGTSRLAPLIVDTLGKFAEFVPVCPEFELGLGVPRETMRLIGDPLSPRLVTTETHVDHTDAMKRWATKRLDELAQENLCGFIFKERSPSCGIASVEVCVESGIPNCGSGIFARAFMERFPRIPVVEAEQLTNSALLEHFVERIFAY